MEAPTIYKRSSHCTKTENHPSAGNVLSEVRVLNGRNCSKTVLFWDIWCSVFSFVFIIKCREALWVLYHVRYAMKALLYKGSFQSLHLHAWWHGCIFQTQFTAYSPSKKSVCIDLNFSLQEIFIFLSVLPLLSGKGEAFASRVVGPSAFTGTQVITRNPPQMKSFEEKKWSLDSPLHLTQTSRVLPHFSSCSE